MVSFFHVLLDDEIFISPSLKYKTLSNKARQRGQELSGQSWRDATKEAQELYPLHPPHPSIWLVPSDVTPSQLVHPDGSRIPLP